jgi:hypothetical protein
MITESERLVVLFESVGYRMLSTELVRQNKLLEPMR